MINLPQSWLEVEIGEIAEVIGGGTPKANDESNFAESGTSIAWITPADLSGYKSKLILHGKRDLTPKGLDSSSARLMPEGSILFSSRAPIGYVAIAGNEIATNQGFKSFVFTKQIVPTYAYYYLKSIRAIAESRGTGTTFKELSGAATKKLPFLIAPLNEQIRIANKLNSVLDKVDAAQTKLERIPTLLQRFRQSVLAVATSGELTREWRDLHGVNSFGDSTIRKCILSMIGGASPKKSDYVSKGMLALNKGDIKTLGRLVIKSAANYVPAEFYEKHKNKIISKGHVVVTLRDLSQKADFLGLISKYQGDEPALITQGMYAITPNADVVIGDYLILFSNSSIYREQVKREKVGVTQVHLRNNQFLDFSIPLPTISEQKEIVRRVESLFTLANNVEINYTEAKKRINRLTQSLLAKAFRGELVPQDPTDEPAFELLKRYQAEREARVSGKKSPRKSKARDKASLEGLNKTAVRTAPANISNLKKNHQASVEDIFLEKMNETYKGEEIELGLLLDSLNYPYEELKKALFNLTKGDLNTSIKPKAKLHWDGVYKIGTVK